MSDMQSEWVWQGFYGPKAAAEAGKVITDQDMRAGAWVPMQGEPPMLLDVGGTQAIIAVMTRVGAPIPTPAGLLDADPSMVGRLVGG